MKFGVGRRPYRCPIDTEQTQCRHSTDTYTVQSYAVFFRLCDRFVFTVLHSDVIVRLSCGAGLCWKNSSGDMSHQTNTGITRPDVLYLLSVNHRSTCSAGVWRTNTATGRFFFGCRDVPLRFHMPPEEEGGNLDACLNVSAQS